jgi:hypothetical protein
MVLNACCVKVSIWTPATGGSTGTAVSGKAKYWTTMSGNACVRGASAGSSVVVTSGVTIVTVLAILRVSV